jgi:hypothetical protein
MIVHPSFKHTLPSTLPEAWPPTDIPVLALTSAHLPIPISLIPTEINLDGPFEASRAEERGLLAPPTAPHFDCPAGHAACSSCAPPTSEEARPSTTRDFFCSTSESVDAASAPWPSTASIAGSQPARHKRPASTFPEDVNHLNFQGDKRARLCGWHHSSVETEAPEYAGSFVPLRQKADTLSASNILTTQLPGVQGGICDAWVDDRGMDVDSDSSCTNVQVAWPPHCQQLPAANLWSEGGVKRVCLSQ